MGFMIPLEKDLLLLGIQMCQLHLLTSQESRHVLSSSFKFSECQRVGSSVKGFFIEMFLSFMRVSLEVILVLYR